MIGAKTNKKQDETIARLAEIHENHTAWVDVTTDSPDKRVYVMFMSPFEDNFSYMIDSDGNTE